MSEKRRGLGRGLGALIPTSLDGARSTRERPVDVFFPELRPDSATPETSTAEATTAPASAVAVAIDERPVETDGGATVAGPDAGATPTTADDPADAAGDGADTRPPRGSGEPGTAATESEAAASVTEVRDDGAAVTADDAPQHDGNEAVAREAAPQPASSRPSDGEAPVGPTAPADGLALPATMADAVAGQAGSSSTGGHPFDGLHGDLTEVPGPRTSGEPTGDTELVPVPGAVFAELPLDEIRPNPRQPRTVFDEEALDELVGSIREIGVLQPVVVRRADEGYELIMGERRWRAAGAAGLESIPAIIRETGDEDLLRDALLENLHRSQLNPLEEAAAYQQLLDDFGCTHDELATRLHRSRPQISNTLRLLKLPPLVQRRVAAGVLSAGHARALLGLADGGAIERLAQRIVAEGLSVRAVEEIVALGGDGLVAKRRAAPRAGVRNEALDALAGRLSDRFETRVKVALGKSRGRLTVEFASVQDLNRILSTLAPEDPGLFHG